MVRFTVALAPGPQSAVSQRGELERIAREMRPGDQNGRSEVVRALPPAEQLFQKQIATIDERRRELTKLDRDLTQLRSGVSEFEALAQARLGELFAELRRLEGATADYSHRLARLRAALEANVADEAQLADLEDDEELAEFAAFSASGARTHPRGPHVPEAARRWLANEASEAKRLYIDLAKRLHPDLARTDEERQRRERIMQRVNEAFRLRDLAALRAVHLESIEQDPNWTARPVTERLAWAEAELRRLDAALEETRLALARLRSGELFRLYSRYESGDPVFADLRVRLEERIARETRRLDRMTESYRRLVDRWREIPVAGA